MKALKAPGHLRPGTRRWWEGIAAEYVLEPHHLKVLTHAAEFWDLSDAARAVRKKHGLTFTDRFGQPKIRPEVSVERDAKIGFARMLRELGLDVEPPADDRRPPSIQPGAHLRVS